MYTIKNGQFVYIDKNNGKYTPLSNDEAAYRIVECIVANYKHRVGPNYVVNDEEVVRMIPLVSENLGVISNGVLLQCLCLLIDSLSNYDPNANLESTYYVSRTIFRISQELIFKQNNAETIRLMVDFSKNTIFELFLINRSYYRYIAAAFYDVVGVDHYAVKYGFFDTNHISDKRNAMGKENAPDVDYVIIPYVYSYIAIQMAEKGIEIDNLEYYNVVFSLAARFWEIVEKSCKNKLYVSTFDFLKLYADCMKINADGSNWHGIAFAIADTKSWFGQQKKIAKKIGYKNWNACVDRRKMLTSSKILLTIAFSICLIILVAIIYYRSVGWAIVFGIAFIIGAIWTLGIDDSARSRIYRQMMIDYDWEQIAIAAQNGLWYTPMYLDDISYYKYVNH